MSSKKARKKLKAQYNNDTNHSTLEKGVIYHGPNYEPFHSTGNMRWHLHNREIVISYFKDNPNVFVTGKFLSTLPNVKVNFPSQFSSIIKRINQYTDFKIEPKKGKGYIHYEEQDNGETK